jgi:N-acetylglucosamine kinase-like BadF-type ATPase
VQSDSSGRSDTSGSELTTLLPLPARLAPNAAPATRPGSGRRWVLGVDGGATKTLAAAYDVETGRLATGESGPSNPHAAGFDGAGAALHEAVAEAVTRAGARPDQIAAAVLAVASVDTEDSAKRLLDDIAPLHDVALTFMTNDVVAAWASGTWGKPGVAAISGTGSNVFGVGTDGATWRCGGWDYLLGDEGAGVWIGLEAMRRATRHRDGRGPWTALVPRLVEVYGMADVADLHEIVYQKLQKSEIAAFARHVSEVADAGDAVAAEILADAGRQLAEQVVTVIRRLDLPERFPVALVGSTYKAGPRLVDPLIAGVRAVAPGAELARPAIPPVGGSLWLAARAAGLESEVDVDALRQALTDPAIENRLAKP